MLFCSLNMQKIRREENTVALGGKDNLLKKKNDIEFKSGFCKCIKKSFEIKKN